MAANVHLIDPGPTVVDRRNAVFDTGTEHEVRHWQSVQRPKRGCGRPVTPGRTMSSEPASLCRSTRLPPMPIFADVMNKMSKIGTTECAACRAHDRHIYAFERGATGREPTDTSAVPKRDPEAPLRVACHSVRETVSLIEAQKDLTCADGAVLVDLKLIDDPQRGIAVIQRFPVRTEGRSVGNPIAVVDAAPKHIGIETV